MKINLENIWWLVQITLIFLKGFQVLNCSWFIALLPLELLLTIALLIAIQEDQDEN